MRDASRLPFPETVLVIGATHINSRFLGPSEEETSMSVIQKWLVQILMRFLASAVLAFASRLFA